MEVSHPALSAREQPGFVPVIRHSVTLGTNEIDVTMIVGMQPGLKDLNWKTRPPGRIMHLLVAYRLHILPQSKDQLEHLHARDNHQWFWLRASSQLRQNLQCVRS